MQLGITKLEKIGFALLSLFFLAATVTAYTVGSGQDINPDIYHNADEWITGGTSLLKLSKTAPYAEIPIQRGANWGGTDREFLQAGHNNRIRQNGTIYQIRFAVADASIITQFYFTIWRKIGNNYDRIAITDDLRNLISNGTNVIDLSTPIEGIQEGDFYGYHIKASGDALYVDKEYTNKTRYDNLTYYADGGATSITNYNWSGQTSANYVFVIEPYMENPYMVFIGDSITSGHGNGNKPDEHYSFIEYDKDKTNIQATIENQWSKKVNYRTYQNMGFGGQKTSTINNRFNSDVVSLSPEFVLIEDHPVNDTITGISTSTILINWEYMIQKAYYNNITPVIMLISPWTNGSNTQLNQFTDINDQLIRIAAKYPPSIVVDARCYVGVERSTGPSGNCWDINPLYTFDGLHYNSAGNERIAQAIKDSFRFVHGKPGLYNLIQSDGTMIYSMNLRNAKNTSWRMASTSGIANVSYNTPSSGELARMTVNSGTVDWFNIGNLSSNLVCDLLDSGGTVLQSASTVDGSVNFTGDITSGTYHVQCTAGTAKSPPEITSWSNSKTNNESLTFTINVSETVNFNAAANQTVTSWNWYKDNVRESNNYDHFSTSWNTAGTKSVRVNAGNENGTSSSIIWTVNVMAEPGTEPLVITISPANNSKHTTNYVNVTATLSKAGTAHLIWDGLDEPMNGNGTGFYRNKTGLLSGNYRFKVYANALDGAFNESETRTVIVNLSKTANINKDPATGNTTQVILSPNGNVAVTLYNNTRATLNGATLSSITINSLKQVDPAYNALPGSYRFAGENLTFDPEGASFSPDIQLRFNYTDQQLSIAGISESSLTVEYYNTTENRWNPLAIYFRDPALNYIIVNVSHFSTFALAGTPPASSSNNYNPGSSGSSGGGGGGGGSSGEDYSNIEVKERYDMFIFKDRITSYKFTNKKNPILSVTVTGNTSSGDITAIVEVLRNTSSLLKTSAPGVVYKNVNIWMGTAGFASTKNIKKASIMFRVDNSWLDSNKLAESDVRLVRWDGSGWITLETEKKTREGGYTSFEAKTDTFSHFAITGLKETITPAVTTQSGIIQGTPSPTNAAAPENVHQINLKLIISVFVLIAIIVLLYMKRK